MAGYSAWFEESIANLGISATFLGVARKVFGQVAGAFTGQMGAQKLRALAASNVTGTLIFDASRDGATWYRVKEVATVALGGKFVAQGEQEAIAPFMRVGYVNGAGAQGEFVLLSAVA